MSQMTTAVERTCLAWDTASTIEPVEALVVCRSGLCLPSSGAEPRFCFLSVGSPLEVLLAHEPDIIDRSGNEIGVDVLFTRLLDGEVSAAISPREPVPPAAYPGALPTDLLERRQAIRRDNVLARFLLRQIGLEEVSSHRGAPPQLYQALRDRWSRDLSLCIDPAMMLTLGADRQRYVDHHFTARATDRLPRALGRLHDLGVRAYPRLVIV